MKNTAWFGIKIFWIPTVIVSIITSFGFTQPVKSQQSNLLLFDTCYNYVVDKDKAESKLSVPEKTEPALRNSYSIPIDGFTIPDTTEGKANLPDTSKVLLSRLDSLRIKAKEDSIKRIDSLAADSTARLEYFHYSRNDNRSVPIRVRKKSSFFAQPSDGTIQRTITIDSTGNEVVIKETIAGKEVKHEIRLPMDQYIQLRLNAITRDLWEEKGYEYKLKDDKKDLSQLITDITNIQIPLPSSPLLSIFGKPEMKLKISGSVDIHGAWRNETTTGITTSALGNSRNEPDFKQQVQINLSGTIGDKLNISADWNTERQFQYENQLKIKYTGFEDEIIQSIEAGNVSLQTSPLVGGGEALFGVKANFKIGPLNLTALASQKKSEVQEISVSSGSQSKKFEIHAYDYSQNHYFIDTSYANDKNFYNYFGNSTPNWNPNKRVQKIEVWKTYNAQGTNANERQASAFIDLEKRSGKTYGSDRRDSNQTSKPGISLINYRWIKLTEGVDYDVHPETGFISFRTAIQDQDAIAVAYEVKGSNTTNNAENDDFYGEFISDVPNADQRLVLKLVKPPTLQPDFKDAWKLQLRNIYPVGGRQLKEEGFNFDLKYQVPGQEASNDYKGINLIQAFGLDKTDKSGTGQPDGAFDYYPGRTILPITGEVIFPHLEPFGKNIPDTLKSLAYDAIYNTTLTFAKQDNTKDKFLLTGDYSASVSSTYSIGFSAVENSVKVFLNGNELKDGVDYIVDYNIGQVIIRNDAALTPGADLRITYEQNDLFQLASKTLLGLRGEYLFNKQTSLGFSFLNLNQQTLSDKVRIGEEPMNNSIYGLDFKTNFELPFITKGLDKLISTSTPSKVNLQAEYAYINPDPNTKKSTVASDNGSSIAYVDDFEGSKRIIPLGMAYGSWHDISVPDNLTDIGSLPQMEQLRRKAKNYWYNRTPSDVTVKDIYGNRKKVAPDANLITTLDFVFDPTQRGFYNRSPILSTPRDNWAGIMKLLSSAASNLVEENIEFIEFWLNIPEAPPGAKINIDLGQISEDVIPNGLLDTEDRIKPNTLLDDKEDTGLDGLFDDAEGTSPDGSNDPNNDDYKFTLNGDNTDYSHVNGTEGNSVSIDLGRIPDTEDLNYNGNLDRVNSYFRYEIPIDTNRAVNPFIQGGGDNAGWYLFRIPLKDFTEKINNPSMSVVETMRLWISGVDTLVHLRFAEMNLVGNQWQKVLSPPELTADDEVLTLSTINVEDNPEYHSPPGVERERDRSQPDYNIFKNEQSLQLKLTDLPDGEKREVIKYLTRPLDVFNYKEMKMFLHADDDSSPGQVSYYKDLDDYASEVYLRFGSDPQNYYEYRQPLQPNPDLTQANWSEISLKFSELTAIKQRRDTSQVNSEFEVAVEGLPGHVYVVKGNPTLTRISFFLIGIINPIDKGPTGNVSGTVWVNELRVLDADDTPGWAYSAVGSINFADLLNINANVSQTNPYFHKLAERFGSRENRLNWTVSADFDVLKLIPFNLAGSNFRISYSRTEQSSNPLFQPGTDIKIDQAQLQEAQHLAEQGYDQSEIDKIVNSIKMNSQTVNVSESWNVSNLRIKVPTDKWYVRDLVNNLSLNFNYNRSFGRSPTVVTQSNWLWNASANYGVTTSRDLFFRPADIPIIGDLVNIFTDYKDVKVYFFPQSLNAGLTASRKYVFTQNRILATTTGDVKPNVQRDFTSTRNAGFNWALTEGGLLNLSLNYNFTIQSSLAYLLTKNDIDRSESEIWHDIFNGNFFGKDFNLRQNVDFRLNPKLPSFLDINRYVNVNSGYSVTYDWQNNFQQEALGRSAGYSSRLTAGLNIKLKSIFAPFFKEEATQTIQQTPQPVGGRRGGRRSQDRRTNQPENRQPVNQPEGNQQPQIQQPQHPDSLAVADSLNFNTESDTVEVAKGPGLASVSLEYLKLGIKWLLLDYDQISINFSQITTNAATGLRGEGTGFGNFWGIKQNKDDAPTRSFMLGLTSYLGPRAKNSNITDNFTHKNDLDFKTSRPLWEGAQLDLTWKVGWGVNKTTTFTTDSNGVVIIPSKNISSTGTIERSFFTLPNTFFSFLYGKSGIEIVKEKYNKNDENKAENLSKAFVEGFETKSLLTSLPFLENFLKYIPRPNWNFNWTGLEKYSFLSFAKRVSLQNTYNSTYSEGWRITPDEKKEIQQQRIEYAFAPLLGVSMQFDEFFGGSFTGAARYSTKSSYSLGVSTANITEAFSKDISITATYTKSGFELPLFGISFKNDIEFSFTYTSGKTSSVIYNMDKPILEGIPQEGKTNTTIEPKIKYVMSSRVSLTIFYKRTSIEPEGASRIPPTTTNEAGVDVHIAIQ